MMLSVSHAAAYHITRQWQKTENSVEVVTYLEALSWHLPRGTQYNQRDTCHSIRVSQPAFELDTSTLEVRGVASEAARRVGLTND